MFKSKRFSLIIIFLFLSTLCFLGFELIGSKIDENGFLIEPFLLIPIGYIFILLSIISFFRINKKNKPQLGAYFHKFHKFLPFFVILSFFIVFGSFTIFPKTF